MNNLASAGSTSTIKADGKSDDGGSFEAIGGGPDTMGRQENGLRRSWAWKQKIFFDKN